MELLNLNDNKEKEQLEIEMANRRWKKYKQIGRKMTPKEINIYRDRYNKSAVYGFKQNKQKYETPNRLHKIKSCRKARSQRAVY